MTFSDLERRDARGQIIQRIYFITIAPFDLERRNSTRGEGRISRGRPCPHRQRGGLRRSRILGVPVYLCIYLLTQNDDVRQGNTSGGEACFMQSTTAAVTVTRGRSLSVPQFRGTPLLMFTPFDVCEGCVTPVDLKLGVLPCFLKSSDQIRRGNTYGEVPACFRGSATPLHIGQCIARFVSDS